MTTLDQRIAEADVSQKIASLRQKPLRPTVFSEAIAERICERLSAGENLRQFCVWPDWPAKRTIKQWAKEQPEFGARMRKIVGTRPRAKKEPDKT